MCTLHRQFLLVLSLFVLRKEAEEVRKEVEASKNQQKATIEQYEVCSDRACYSDSVKLYEVGLDLIRCQAGFVLYVLCVLLILRQENIKYKKVENGWRP